MEGILPRFAWFEMPVEDIICVNCAYRGFGREARKCVYIPLNNRTDFILRQKLPIYADAADKFFKERVYAAPSSKKKDISKPIILAIISIFASTIVAIAVCLNVVSIGKRVLAILLTFLCFTAASFAKYIADFLYRKTRVG